MNSPLPHAVIFDWDNTLVDSWGAINEAMNATLAHFGRPLWTPEEVRANCTRAARDSFPEWFGDRWQEASDVFYARFAEVQMANLSPLAGAADLLAWLSGRSVPLFVVSNKNGDYLRREAAVLEWERYFAAIVGSTDAPRDKPAREHVDYALRETGIEAGPDIWFVGDSETDIACARNAGCMPVFIGRPDEAQRHGVDLAVADCAALLGLLQERLRAIA
ncbi:MAG: HAD family hydrolase [Alphaproteobacteria bacterium]|nr:HAD family hydrolase [Alphaproteobacteria bacterium]